MMPFKIFIDTEFTDFNDPQLISIGLVAESGEEFYAEVPYDLKRCSSFVCDVVIPLLDNSPESRISFDDLYMRISNWLRIIRPNNDPIEICFDYQTDWDLFARALDNRVPAWCQSRLVARNINELLRYNFHKKNQLPEHHALNDARANCYAFRERPSPIEG
jgi:hypothetical protein